MALVQGDFDTHGTTGTAGTGDQAEPQNNNAEWLGKYVSQTPVPATIGNVFGELTLAELASSTKYRCLGYFHTNGADTLLNPRMVSRLVGDLPAGVTVETGFQANASATVAPLCTDTTPPAGIIFNQINDSTGNPNADYATASKIGPLDLPADGTTELAAMTNDTRIFIYVKLTCLNVQTSLDNVPFGYQVIGED